MLQRDADRHAGSAAVVSVQSGLGSSRENAAQALAPLRVDHLEIRIGLLDPLLQLDLAGVSVS